MNEIFEAYGVESTLNCDMCEFESWIESIDDRMDCENYPHKCKKFYPAITAEKVLELIKSITSTRMCNYLGFKNSVTTFYCQYLGFSVDRVTEQGDSFTEALCNLLIKLKDQFSENEVEKIKGILSR